VKLLTLLASKGEKDDFVRRIELSFAYLKMLLQFERIYGSELDGNVIMHGE
jgi:hypothetical protein